MRIPWLGAACAAVLVSTGAGAGGEIHGTVETRNEGTFSGPIRWDRNENFWDDLLDATKVEPEPAPSEKKKKEEGFRFSLFGLDLLRAGDNLRLRSSLSVPFGEIRSIEAHSDGARIVLKNGEILEAEGNGSTDLSPAMRSLVVEDAKRGRVELKWSSLARVEFRQGPPGPGWDARRLHGTVETPEAEFTGFLVWENDEALDEDKLDAETAAREERHIPFGEIRQIVPHGPSASAVTLKSGEMLELSGTNDVDERQGGITVQLAGVGHVQIPWQQVRKVVFSKPPASVGYGAFDGGKRISGKTRSLGGEILSGAITWDRDESHDWEFLDGDFGGIAYSVSFRNIRSIRRVSGRSSEVRLRDGRTLLLSDSNDVGDDNRGILVEAADGTRHELSRSDVEIVEFD